MNGRALFPFLALLSLVLSSELLSGAQDTPGDTPLRHARVVSDSARVLNLADDKGVVIAEPSAGSLVAVYEEHEAGWLLVEVPGGFAVWVIGRYLEATTESDVYEVTRNAVNIRPLPASDVTSFPLPQRLHAGDRLRVLETLDADKPMAETWARIVSPPGVRAWMHVSATETIAGDEDGAALWALALQNPNTPQPAGAAPESDPVEVQALADLEAARAMLKTERAKSTPDLGSVRASLEAILVAVPTGEIAADVNRELELLGHLEKAIALEAELESERDRRTAEALAYQRAVWSKSRKKDPLGDVFLSRGVLVRRTDADGVPEFQLRFGNETQCELFCPSGRYDLERFAGYEVGVLGTARKRTAEASVGNALPGILVTRLEVIATR